MLEDMMEVIRTIIAESNDDRLHGIRVVGATDVTDNAVEIELLMNDGTNLLLILLDPNA